MYFFMLTGSKKVARIAPNFIGVRVKPYHPNPWPTMTIKNPISELFGQSPIKPMQQHMAIAVEAANLLDAFLRASDEGQWDRAADLYKHITDKEHQADAIKMEIRLHLPKSLLLPVPRYDLLELLSIQDKIANIAKDISGLMLGREMQFPEVLRDTVWQYLTAAQDTVGQALKAVDELDELLEFGFKGRELKIVEDLITRLNELEHLADEQEIKTRSALYAIEGELPPVDVMFYYRIIEKIGSLADVAQRVGSRLTLLLAR